MYSLKALQNYLSSFSDSIEKIKVTKLERTDFNSMEGYQWYFNVKIFLTNGRTHLIKIHTNDTYMEDFLIIDGNEPVKESLTEWLQVLL